MSCLIRRMRREDIAQVTEIDREAFPTMWPPANYNRELEIGLAHYIVASKSDETIQIPDIIGATEKTFPFSSKAMNACFNNGRPSARDKTDPARRQNRSCSTGRRS